MASTAVGANPAPQQGYSHPHGGPAHGTFQPSAGVLPSPSAGPAQTATSAAQQQSQQSQQSHPSQQQPSQSQPQQSQSSSGPSSSAAPMGAAASSYGRHPLPTQSSQPPPSSSQQSFGLGQQSQQTGIGQYHRSFGDTRNGQADVAPQIYSAVYSGVDVYEMEVNTVAVMRRRTDSWLNATQILKVAGVDKGKRTKILEKEIQTGEHEKVQGGYGKYQGTWIRFERGVEVCRQYGVEDLLRPLLTYDMGQDGGVAGRGGDLNTPTKEQAMAAQRKRMYTNTASQENRPPGGGMTGTFFKNISSTASHAVAAISKARFDSPGPRHHQGHHRAGMALTNRAPSFSRQSSLHDLDGAGGFPPNSQQSFTSDYGPGVESNGFGPGGGGGHDDQPRKRARLTTPAESSTGYDHMYGHSAGGFPPGSPTEPNESFVYNNSSHNCGGQHGGQQLANGGGGSNVGGGPLNALLPLQFDVTPEADRKRGQLMELFMGPDAPAHEVLGTMTPTDIEMPIDVLSHNALHWAATLSRTALLRNLVACGGSPFRVNAAGETPLMRACIVTNSLDHGSFPELLEILGGTIEARDNKGRTVLHHIAMTSGVKGRCQASRYYLESLLEWVVRQGSVPDSSSQATNGAQSSQSQPPSQPQSQPQSQSHLAPSPRMGIARFMSDVVNVQDYSGDTALNIAARIGNRGITSQLLEVGADPNIANRAGLQPIAFGVGADPDVDGMDHGGIGPSLGTPAAGGDGNGAGGGNNSQKSRENSDEVIGSITMLFGESGSTFQNDLRSKQNNVDQLHTALRTDSGRLCDSRKSLETMHAALLRQQLHRQKVTNLSQARDDKQLPLLGGQDESSGAAPSSASASTPPDAPTGWETELRAVVETAGDSDTADSVAGMLPSTAVLLSRVQAVSSSQDATQRMVLAMRSRSRDVEIKYRRVVSLCTTVPESEVDAVVDGLLKAVESEREELEIGRVRRFLGGVEGAVH